MSQSEPAVPPPAPEPAAAIPPGAGEAEHSPLDNLVGLYTEPRSEFGAILRRPVRFWIPLVVAAVLTTAFTALWISKVDAEQFIRTQIEDSGRADNIPADRMEEVVEQQARFMKIVAPISGLIGPALAALVLGGLFLFVYRFFYASEVTFLQSMSVVAWSFLVVALVTLPLTLAVFAAKGDWNLDPNSALQANLSLALDKEATARPLYVLAESLDLFTGWTIFLMATGYAVASRRPTSSAAWGIVIPYALWVLGKMGLAMLMS
jgi:hypothetical protein